MQIQLSVSLCVLASTPFSKGRVVSYPLLKGEGCQLPHSQRGGLSATPFSKGRVVSSTPFSKGRVVSFPLLKGEAISNGKFPFSEGTK